MQTWQLYCDIVKIYFTDLAHLPSTFFFIVSCWEDCRHRCGQCKDSNTTCDIFTGRMRTDVIPGINRDSDTRLNTQTVLICHHVSITCMRTFYAAILDYIPTCLTASHFFYSIVVYLCFNAPCLTRRPLFVWHNKEMLAGLQ